MRTITLFLCAALAVTSIDAASYEQTDGTIVDPILDVHGNVLSYSGDNLKPNAWLHSADLSDADLSFASLEDAVLYNADLTDANLSDAYLRDADLRDADLSDANLTDAVLWNANLRDAYLRSANLRFAWLEDANFSDADLTDAYLRDAWLEDANFSDADLSGSDFTNVAYYNDATWTDAFYYTDNEPTWDIGMDAAWRTSVGILALAPTNAVPEPSTILLALLGLALVPRRRRR